MAADGNPEVDLETGNHPNGGEEDEREMGYIEREIFLQVELYADEVGDSPEIKRKKRIARAALTSWKEKAEMHDHRILEIASEKRSITNEVYQLVGLYSVLEGVVLTAVATSSTLECQHLWSPVSLSLFAYSMLVVVAVKKFRDIRHLQWSLRGHSSYVKEIRLNLMLVGRRGYAEFDFDRDCWAIGRNFTSKPPLWKNALGLLVPLTIFTALLVFSVVHILCWS